MRNAPEVVREVGVDDFRMASEHQRFHLDHRLLGVAPGTVGDCMTCCGREIFLVVRWLDRLGRNYTDVTDTVREFIRRGIRIETVINRMSFDGTTKDPMKCAIRDSLLAFMAAMAQSQAEVTKQAQKAGIAHALAHDDGSKYRGRKPTFRCDQFAVARELLSQGTSSSAVARETGLKRQTVYRIKTQPERQMAALRVWFPENVSSCL